MLAHKGTLKQKRFASFLKNTFLFAIIQRLRSFFTYYNICILKDLNCGYGKKQTKKTWLLNSQYNLIRNHNRDLAYCIAPVLNTSTPFSFAICIAG